MMSEASQPLAVVSSPDDFRRAGRSIRLTHYLYRSSKKSDAPADPYAQGVARMIFARCTSRNGVLRTRADLASATRSSSVTGMDFATRMALILPVQSLGRQQSK